MNILRKIMDFTHNIKSYIKYDKVLYLCHDKIKDITILYYFFIFIRISFLFNEYNNEYIYSYYDMNKNKYFIKKTTLNKLIYKQEDIVETGEINKPRNLFIKYSVKVNNCILDTNEKIHYKKYDKECNLLDVFKFNNINIKEIIIYKNIDEHKKYIEHFDTIKVKDIYEYL
jgi:hypothetical protein